MHCSSKISYYLEKKISFQMLSKSLHTCSFFHSTTCKGIPLFKIPWNDRVYLDLRLFCLVFLCICVVQCFIFFNIHVLCNVVVKKKKKNTKEIFCSLKSDFTCMCLFCNENCNYTIRLKPNGSSCKFKRVNAHVTFEMFAL